tara:strand:+ start:373 stop:624 length:252 start_codon:yes stop_codon:yes gene_type:complete
MNCPDVMTLATLDEVAECWDGVDTATISELYDQLLDDPRDAADDWDPASWKECSPNNVEKSWSRLPKELQAKLIQIAAFNEFR